LADRRSTPHDSGRVAPDGVRGGLSFDDIAILYRTGNQTRPLMAALAKEGLPFQRRSHDRLRDHPGVRALLPYLRSTHGSATVPLLRAAGAAALRELEDDEEDIRAAIDLLGPLASRHTPEALLAELALGSEVDTWDPRANRISLLTLHAAKGLEFPVVFIVGCAEGLLPLRWPGDDADVSEERRLFFVGVSRAQAHLYLSHPARDTPRARPTPVIVPVRLRRHFGRAHRRAHPRPTTIQPTNPDVNQRAATSSCATSNNATTNTALKVARDPGRRPNTSPTASVTTETPANPSRGTRCPTGPTTNTVAAPSNNNNRTPPTNPHTKPMRQPTHPGGHVPSQIRQHVRKMRPSTKQRPAVGNHQTTR